MPHREFIHTSSDVASLLLYALDSGMQVRLDEPQTERHPRILSRADVTTFDRGIFFLFRPEWVYGPFQTTEISGGYNRGKHFVMPRVNYSPIEICFQGERDELGRRRLGSGILSFHNDWLELPAKVLHRPPPEVKEWFKRMAVHLLTPLAINAGVHRYYLSRGVVADPDSVRCVPPFDFKIGRA